MSAIEGGLMAHTPTNTTLNDRRAAVTDHLTTAFGCSLGNLNHLRCGHFRRIIIQGGKALFLTVCRPLAVGSVSSDIICSIGSKSRNLAGKASCTLSRGNMAVTCRRAMVCTPADTAFFDAGAAIRHHRSAHRGHCDANVFNLIGFQRWQ